MRITVAVAILGVLLGGCSWFQTAPISEYIEQEQIPMGAFVDLGITPEMENRLVNSFAEQVDWTSYDGSEINLARSAIKSELLWIKFKISTSGSLNYYAASNSYEKIQYWWGLMMVPLDKMVMDGEVDQDTSLIYYFVRKSIVQNLALLNVSLDKSKGNIQDRTNQYTLSQFKELADNLSPLLAGIL